MNAHCTHGPKTVGAPSRGSVPHPSGPPADVKNPRGDRPRALCLRTEGVRPQGRMRRSPSPGSPQRGPEPSRAQLLLGRAASLRRNSKLPLAPTRVCPTGSRQPPEKGPRVLAWCSLVRMQPAESQKAKSALAVPTHPEKQHPVDTSPLRGPRVREHVHSGRGPERTAPTSGKRQLGFHIVREGPQTCLLLGGQGRVDGRGLRTHP